MRQAIEEQPPLWFIRFADGHIHYAGEATWEDLGDWVDIATIKAIQTHDRIVCLELLPHRGEHPWLSIYPPEPLPFFSFARYATSPLADEPSWLYTLFGYTLGDYYFTWKVLPDQFHEIRVCPRTTPILL